MLSLPLRPVVQQPIFEPRIWGSRHLPSWYPPTAGNDPIGEVWLTSDASSIDTFPLLIKVLLPNEKLSVQVHPNDAEAKALGQPRGKTECWYILAAEPGATVAVGLLEPLSSEAIREAIAAQTLESKLRHIPVKVGDMVFVEAGTVHAIGPGLTVLEVQQHSDITFRMFDYGRPRELHVEEGLAVTKAVTTAGIVAPTNMGEFARLAACEYFFVDRFNIAAQQSATLTTTQETHALIALNDDCHLRLPDGSTTELLPGFAVLVPPQAEPCALEAGAQPAEVIRVMQP